MVTKKKLQKENDNLREKLVMQNMAIVGLGVEKRDMYMGPNEFVLSVNHDAWKDIKITYKKKDMTKKITKIIILGTNLL